MLNHSLLYENGSQSVKNDELKFYDCTRVEVQLPLCVPADYLGLLPFVYRSYAGCS